MAAGREVQGQANEKGVRKYQVEKEAIQVESLLQLPRFCCLFALFCSLRCIHPSLLGVLFPEGPQKDDALAEVCTTFSWLVALGGLLAAALLYEPLRERLAGRLLQVDSDLDGGLLERGCLVVQLDLLALRLLALWLLLEVIYQLLALLRHDLFWSSQGLLQAPETDAGAGQDDPEAGGDDAAQAAAALVLLLLQAGGLLGSALLLAAYGRCYRAAWRGLCERRVAAQDEEDAEAARERAHGQCSCSRPPSDCGQSQEPAQPGPRWAEGRHTHAQAQRLWPREEPTPTPPSSTQPSAAASGPSNDWRHPDGPESWPDPDPDASGPTPPPSSGSTPRAWLWTNDSWVRVRVLRSVGSGAVTVRLPGGAVVQTRQSLLIRSNGEEEGPPPPRAPTPQPQPQPEPQAQARTQTTPQPQAQPPHAQQARQQRRSSGPKPEAQQASEEEPPPPAAGVGVGVEGGRQQQSLSLEERWAAQRLEQLRRELQALDLLPSAAEKRAGLRALQRELHPDKQPPERRVHAQPLFQLVQKEWEIDTAAASQRQKSSAAA